MLWETQLIHIDLFMNRKVFKRRLEKIPKLFKLQMGLGINETQKYKNPSKMFKKYICLMKFYNHNGLKLLLKIKTKKY
jgi:hypothetical protein